MSEGRCNLEELFGALVARLDTREICDQCFHEREVDIGGGWIGRLADDGREQYKEGGEGVVLEEPKLRLDVVT